MILNLLYLTTSICLVNAVQHLTSDMLTEERMMTSEQNRSSHVQDVDDMSSMKDLERDKSSEESKEKKSLDRALGVVLDPDAIIINKSEGTQDLRIELVNIENENLTLPEFMERMDELSLTACKRSQNALWAFIEDTSDRAHRENMISFAIEDDEIRRRYWETIKEHYKDETKEVLEETLIRKLKVIEERATTIVLPVNKQRVEIENMQRIWSTATVCSFGDHQCRGERGKTLGEITKIFESSKNVDELLYYWKEFRNTTGRKIRPSFKTYIDKVNTLARRDDFADAGEVWRYSYEDEHTYSLDFEKTVERLWSEVKELYDLLLEYVKSKLVQFYDDKFIDKDTMPEHLLGNLWAQQWQEVYSIALPYPKHSRPTISPAKSVSARKIFDFVDDFIQSLGFESVQDSYKDVKDFENITNCMMSSHDLCDGKNYRVRWCQLSWDLATNYAKAAKLLGHVQYFKQYGSQPIVFRNGPTPAFLEAIPEIFANQISVLDFENHNDADKTQLNPEVTINNLFWTALEKLPMMGYGFVLDKWRWDLFSNSSLVNWNEHWWNLRKNITGISAPLPRNEKDLDPASAYHVVSHLPYITQLISNILQFQILRSLCNNNTGGGGAGGAGAGAGAGAGTQLHHCRLYGRTDVGERLRTAMSYGSSRNWKSILKELTNETELSAQGLLDYFKPLKDYLQEENSKLALAQDTDVTTPIIVGIILLILTVIIISVYCLKKHKLDKKLRIAIGFGKNGSLDITNEMSGKVNEGVSSSAAVEDKV